MKITSVYNDYKYPAFSSYYDILLTSQTSFLNRDVSVITVFHKEISHVGSLKWKSLVVQSDICERSKTYKFLKII